MKRLILILLLTIPISLSLYGGETLNYTFEKCSYITVEIKTDNISYSEWIIEPNCTETSLGFWECYCEDNWDILLTPRPNAVGTYELTLFNYYTVKTETETIHHYNTRKVYIQNKTNITETIEVPTIKEVPIERIVKETLYKNQTIEVPIEIPVKQTNWIWVIVFSIVSLIIGVILTKIFMKGD
ncbi:MAG: hypothetical protein ACTSPI_03550 [Candidatus Heimdallarchaeaceae archaeon]